MTGTWETFGWTSAHVPRAPLTDDARARLGLPRTLLPVADDGATQPSVFDPALKQYPNAYRAGEPVFADPAAGAAWRAARRTAMGLVLAAVADSPWRDHLVLRGSALLTAWFGDAAREPGDLDFVVVPTGWRIEEERTTAMLDGLARAAERAGAASPVRIDASGAVGEDIWTYDRVPGRRLVLPWTGGGAGGSPDEGTGGGPGGIVQLDFVFNEVLPVAPEPLLVDGSLLSAATAELSLAWKLMWLVSDLHPQGKDLYDAVLLAEHCTLRYETLRAVFHDAEPYYKTHPVTAATIAAIPAALEWQHFVSEYPHLALDQSDQVARLCAALAPTFAAGPAADDALDRWWREPWPEHRA